MMKQILGTAKSITKPAMAVVTATAGAMLAKIVQDKVDEREKAKT